MRNLEKVDRIVNRSSTMILSSCPKSGRRWFSYLRASQEARIEFQRLKWLVFRHGVSGPLRSRDSVVNIVEPSSNDVDNKYSIKSHVFAYLDGEEDEIVVIPLSVPVNSPNKNVSQHL